MVWDDEMRKAIPFNSRWVGNVETTELKLRRDRIQHKVKALWCKGQLNERTR